MATKKTGKSSSKSKAGKKGSSKSVFKDLLEQDPPIVVGGGSSVYVFLKASATSYPSPVPGYIGFKLSHNIKFLYVSDGMGGTNSIPVDSKKHNARFQD
jgi:hypothetical protein